MKLPSPIVALEVNDRCYGSCAHCTYEKRRYKRLLTEKQLKAIIDAVCDIGCQVISFTGREPLHEGQWDMTVRLVRYARQRGAKTVGINTGAKALAGCIESLVGAGLYVDSLDVSVDGYGEVHDAIRGHREWEVIEGLLDKKNRGIFKDITCHICVSTVLQRQNCTCLFPLLEWLRDKSCVKHMMIAAASMTGKHDRSSALPRGAFRRFLQELSAWQAENQGLETVLEIPPDSVPEICEMVKEGLITPEKVAMNDAGIAVVHVNGLPVRLMCGLYGVSVLRIRADGLAYIGYANLLQLPTCNAADEDFYGFLDDMVCKGHLYSMLEERVNQLARGKGACPAWPFHLDRCPDATEKREV